MKKPRLRDTDSSDHPVVSDRGSYHSFMGVCHPSQRLRQWARSGFALYVVFKKNPS